MADAPAYRLTDSGKRLWRMYLTFTLHEIDEATFIDMLQDARPIWGTCFSCGKDVNNLVATLYCVGCTGASYRKTS